MQQEKQPWTNKVFIAIASIFLLIAILLLIFVPDDNSEQAGQTSFPQDPFVNPVYCKSPWPDVSVFAIGKSGYLLPKEIIERIGSPAEIKRLFPGEIVLIANSEQFVYETYSVLYADVEVPPLEDITRGYEKSLRDNKWKVIKCERQMDRARGRIDLCSASKHTVVQGNDLPETEVNDHLAILIAVVDNGLYIGHHRLIPPGASTSCTK